MHRSRSYSAVFMSLLLFSFLFTATAWGKAPRLKEKTAQNQWQLPKEKPQVEPQKSATESKTTTKIIPLPIYSTLPNEGSTFGFMPVFLFVEDPSQRTQSIVAPSVSWNQVVRYSTTFRWYYYPSEHEVLTFIPSFSTHVNRNLTLEYASLPANEGNYTVESNLHLRRDIFYRFFGLGPLSKEGDETSYTRVGGDASTRVGYNITSRFNVGLAAEIQRQLVERVHVSFLPLTNDKFPSLPGLTGSTVTGEGLSLRYDTRVNREYAPSGIAAELFGSYNQDLVNKENFTRLQAEVKGIWPETEGIQGAARAFWSGMNGNDIPFTSQNNLGGSFRLRGFTENRFVDYNAWEAEIEQRITLFQTHIYGVTADWRIDPFVAVGQVYHNASDALKHAKWAGGLGFRAFVQPNVLGRVDTAYSEDGLKIYVELGYPF